MRDLMKRLERLEQGQPSTTGGRVFLLSWMGELTCARAGGAELPRLPNEGASDFKKRAADHFRPNNGKDVFVWVQTAISGGHQCAT